ncbi:hypothetical protein [Photobacterium leiognathi]|nr:hypothetical protein [Photobacterium leiognathi]
MCLKLKPFWNCIDVPDMGRESRWNASPAFRQYSKASSEMT